MIRPATVTDVPALVELENSCFDSDRLSARQIRYLLTKARAETLVEESEGRIRGYVLVLFSRATSSARLYSIAVDPAARKSGLARSLLAAAEEGAKAEGKAYMRLEIRRDNLPSQRLFLAAGYRQFAVEKDYYEDHAEALRYEKCLAPHLHPDMARVPYYEQTLDFTCGSSCLMMAMKALRPELELDRRLELRIWREATMVFMTSGHGGCSPHGLALAAHRRGFGVEIFVNDEGPPLLATVRSEEKKEVIRLVHEDMGEEARSFGIPVRHRTLSVDGLRERFDRGGIPIVLISSARIYDARFPHWVVVTGFDGQFIYVNDPFVDYEEDESSVDSINMPIEQREFSRIARYGRAGLQAVVMLYPEPTPSQIPAAPDG
jgi:ribosomal protein S18 acetylase RimI-like enzyme